MNATDLDEITMRAILQASFKCAGCGNCCRICADIHATDNDVTRIAKHLDISVRQCKKKYTRRHSKDPKKLSLRNKRACVFFDRLHKTCKIYDARPGVCRSYPFLDSTVIGEPIGACFPDCLGQLMAVLELQAWTQSMSDEYRERCIQQVDSMTLEEIDAFRRQICRAADAKIFGEA